jgi:ABC-type thiamine transport system ATPase subunit
MSFLAGFSSPAAGSFSIGPRPFRAKATIQRPISHMLYLSYRYVERK